jgi:hypothetical protein
MKCKARRIAGEWECHECRLRWDCDDHDPPKCGQADGAKFDSTAPASITAIREKYEKENAEALANLQKQKNS